jgi:hypothetical protein
MGKGEASVVMLTMNFRVQHWPGTEGWYIISMDHAGNPIGIAPDGRVMRPDHDFGGVHCEGQNFEDFIRKFCLELDK